MATKPSILEVMQQRPVIGDGSAVLTLEKRGYVKAGCFTPEAVVEYPEAGKVLRSVRECRDKKEFSGPQGLA